MASPPATKAGVPPGGKSDKSGGGDKKIFGMDRTAVIVVGAAFGLALLYFWIQSKKQPQGGAGGGGKGPQHNPTGLQRQHLTIWVKDHGGHRGR